MRARSGVRDDAVAVRVFARGLVAVDRDLGYTSLLEASATFYRHVMNATEVNSSAGMFYREYAGAVREATKRGPSTGLRADRARSEHTGGPAARCWTW